MCVYIYIYNSFYLENILKISEIIVRVWGADQEWGRGQTSLYIEIGS